MSQCKIKIGSAYDPARRPVLDEDAQLVQRALVPGIDNQPGIRFPRITIDGLIFAVSVFLWIVILVIWIHSLIAD
jgi:hypothetical protein